MRGLRALLSILKFAFKTKVLEWRCFCSVICPLRIPDNYDAESWSDIFKVATFKLFPEGAEVHLRCALRRHFSQPKVYS